MGIFNRDAESEAVLEDGLDQPPAMPMRDWLERVRTIMDALSPRKPPLMPWSSIFGGRAPNINLMFLAAAETEMQNAILDWRQEDMEKLNPVGFLREHAPSVQGRREKALVEIGRTTVEKKKVGLFGTMQE